MTVEKLSQHPNVQSLQAEWFIPLDDIVEDENVSPNNTLNLQWGVDNVNAEAVWNTGNRGQNTVIGVIDTGARHTHTFLRDSYRGNFEGGNHNYNWFTPIFQFQLTLMVMELTSLELRLAQVELVLHLEPDGLIVEVVPLRLAPILILCNADIG